MSGWTKGSWSVDGPPWNQIVWSSTENRVCFLAHSDGLDDERDIATGRLIAAAPDLAEAARELCRAYPEFDEDNSIVNLAARYGTGFASAVKLARAALLKATGE